MFGSDNEGPASSNACLQQTQDHFLPTTPFHQIESGINGCLNRILSTGIKNATPNIIPIQRSIFNSCFVSILFLK